MIHIQGFNYNFYKIQTEYFSKKGTSFYKYFFICPCISTNFFKRIIPKLKKKKVLVLVLLHMTFLNSPLFPDSNRITPLLFQLQET